MDPAHPAGFRVSPAGLESKILCIFMYVYLCIFIDISYTIKYIAYTSDSPVSKKKKNPQYCCYILMHLCLAIT